MAGKKKNWARITKGRNLRFRIRQKAHPTPTAPEKTTKIEKYCHGRCRAKFKTSLMKPIEKELYEIAIKRISFRKPKAEKATKTAVKSLSSDLVGRDLQKPLTVEELTMISYTAFASQVFGEPRFPIWLSHHFLTHAFSRYYHPCVVVHRFFSTPQYHLSPSLS